MPSIPSLSPIWATLPREVVEQVLAHYVAAHFYTDPALTWARLRHLSAAQKRAIECDFAAFWLRRRRFSVTLYHGGYHQADYAEFEPWSAREDVSPEGKVTFALNKERMAEWDNDGMEWMETAWEGYDPVKVRNLTVRLGEGVLSGGCRGGYIVNDTGLPGLEVLDGGKRIRFNWKEALGNLLREEMYMREKGEELEFADACNTWLASTPPDEESDDGNARMPPPNVQIKLWLYCVQIPRRVAALRHRFEKAKANGDGPWKPEDKLWFSPWSRYLHKQKVAQEDIDAISNRTCCSICSRSQPPDIFEVVHTEESAVPQLDVFRSWLGQNGGNVGGSYGDEEGEEGEEEKEEEGDEEEAENDPVGWKAIADLYAEGFGWMCCIVQGRDDEKWQETRAEDYRKFSVGSPRKLLIGDRGRRWDILG